MKKNTKYITNWMKTFLDQEGTWPVKSYSVNEVSTLISKACRGRGLPNGHAFEMASLASVLMSDQVWMGFFVGALYDTLDEPVISLDNKILTINRAKFIISGPMAIDALISGVQTVVLRDMPWNRLVLPLLINAQNKYKCFFSFKIIDSSVVISHSNTKVLSNLGDPKLVPDPVIDALDILAKKTYVPSSEISRRFGAGAGLIDTD